MSNKRKRKALVTNTQIESEIFISANSYSDKALAEMSELLSIWGMTPLQYNALRVLYVEDSENMGLPSKEIGSRLYTRVPDVTRLLDRMADKGWLTRERDSMNKRVVRSRLTDIGMDLVESAHAPLMEWESQQLAHLSEEEKKTLARLLDKALKN